MSKSKENSKSSKKFEMWYWGELDKKRILKIHKKEIKRRERRINKLKGGLNK